MFGRRSHERFKVTASSGTLRVPHDVRLDRADGEELIAIGRKAGVVGDALTVELAPAGEVQNVSVRVLESCPIVEDGVVRHRLRLGRLSDEASNRTAPAGRQEP
jgi:hypothetical protein